ncbi:MAG TPA: hypothetical protein VH108_08870 [Gaiellaceae bacterium]|jgi:hypothetical protein|nr:hypothetical protein [Gaiellaceae bacterium]
MSVARQWKVIGSELPETWASASLRLELPDRAAADQAAATLGPTGPYRVSATVLQFSVARDGSALGPQGVTNLLSRIPAGTLSLSNSQASAKPVEREETTLVESWDTALAELPSDWSDLYAEVEFTSSDYIEPGAVLCIQMNPRRDGTRAAFNFRAARLAGYGVAPGMARRCFERCDEQGMHGSISVLRVLSDTHLVATQGPVWLAGGKTL